MNPKSTIDALNEWKVSRDHLADVAQTFRRACATLLHSVEDSATTTGSLDYRSIEDDIMKIHNQMDAITAVEKQMAGSRALVHRILNMSTNFVPMNILPSEIISYIFKLTLLLPFDCPDFEHPHRRLHPLAVLPTVCTRWRSIAFSTRSLWSHIDLHEHSMPGWDTSLTRRTRLWLERGHGGPLHLHIGLLLGSRPENERQLISLLGTRVTDVSSLQLSSSATKESLRTTLSFYASYCSTGALTSLSVEGIAIRHGDTEPLIWPAAALHGLHNLQLNEMSEEASPSMNELVTILSNSPGLHTLRLQQIYARTAANRVYTKVNLPSLRLLQLMRLNNNEALPVLLSILEPGKLELDVRLSLDPNAIQNSTTTIIRSFFKRTNVICLNITYIEPGEAAQFGEYLSCLPGLRILGLDGLRDQTHLFLDELAMLGDNGRIGIACTGLRLLYMANCPMGWREQYRLTEIMECFSLATFILGRNTITTIPEEEDILPTYWSTCLQEKRVVCDESWEFGLFVGREWDFYLH